MTHFVGLVLAESEQELDKLLQPYHEYECTGIKDQYVEEVDYTEQVKEYVEKYNSNNLSFEEFCEEEGYIYRDGKAYALTNPNRKWDWWTVGGRWSNEVPGNKCKVEEIEKYFTKYVPGVFVDKEGWHEAKEYGWFGYSEETQTPDIVKSKLEENKGKSVWIVDFHI